MFNFYARSKNQSFSNMTLLSVTSFRRAKGRDAGKLSVCIRAIVRRGLRANMHFGIGRVELYDVPRTDMVGLLRSAFWLVKDLTLEATKSFKIVCSYRARKWAAMIRVAAFSRNATKKEPFINFTSNSNKLANT